MSLNVPLLPVKDMLITRRLRQDDCTSLAISKSPQPRIKGGGVEGNSVHPDCRLPEPQREECSTATLLVIGNQCTGSLPHRQHQQRSAERKDRSHTHRPVCGDEDRRTRLTTSPYCTHMLAIHRRKRRPVTRSVIMHINKELGLCSFLNQR